MKNTLHFNLDTTIFKFLLVAVMVMSAAFVHAEQKTTPKVPLITVYKSPTCGCCEKWITHLRKQGFDVSSQDSNKMPKVKQVIGVKPEYQSCHTAIIGDYYIEGHVPGDDIRRLLKEKPDALGLSVPGMHVGSPGMEQGNKKQHYTVYLIKKDGKKVVYHQY